MKFENTEVFNFEGSLRGMRNPKNSWNRCDSKWEDDKYIIGPNDMKLATMLISAGPEHRKFLRQIFVSVDITAPLYWYKEFDTYKIGTVANSTSTMHKITSNPITIDSFETGDWNERFDEGISTKIIPLLESLRTLYLDTNDTKYWKELIRWLPEGWLQTRTWTANYEVLRTMYHQRANHKLAEWHTFCAWVETLPYAKEFIMS